MVQPQISGNRSGVQARIKRHIPHFIANSNWLVYRLLMLLVVLNMYMTTYESFFHYSPKHPEFRKSLIYWLSSHHTHAGSPMSGVYKLRKLAIVLSSLVYLLDYVLP